MGRDVSFGRDELAHYYYAQAMYKYDDRWKTYYSAMFDHLQGSQKSDGCWPAGDGFMAGPVYSTAVWCTILQLDRNCHPVAHRSEAIRASK
jgi:hypothetical protein